MPAPPNSIQFVPPTACPTSTLGSVKRKEGRAESDMHVAAQVARGETAAARSSGRPIVHVPVDQQPFDLVETSDSGVASAVFRTVEHALAR